jgi:hypothetical protein
MVVNDVCTYIANSSGFTGIWLAWHYVKNYNDYTCIYEQAGSDIIHMW